MEGAGTGSGDGSQYVSAGFLSALEDAARKLQEAEKRTGEAEEWSEEDDDYAGEGQTRSLPRTPGGTVIMNPVSWHGIPSFKSPGATPVHSTGHSRAQSRGHSRGHSRGTGALSAGGGGGDDDPSRRSRAKTSHLMATEDEFVIPAGASREEDMYASDEEEVEGWGAGGKLQPLEARRSSSRPAASRRAKTAEPTLAPIRGKTTFGTSPNKTSTELVMARARELPGPADYELVPRRKRRGWTLTPGGRGPSQVDALQRSAARLPGPAHYVPHSEEKEVCGGRISSSVTPGMFDGGWRSPGPSYYQIPSLGQRPSVRISTAPRQTSLDALAQAAASYPGPGQYRHDMDEDEAASWTRLSVSREYASRGRQRARKAAQRRQEEDEGRDMAELAPTRKPSSSLVAASRLLSRSGESWYGQLPSSSELCFELRSRVPIQRAYLEQGIELS